MSFIPSAVHNLSLIDLTNRNQILFFREKLVEDGTNLFEEHLEFHSELCNCLETERTLALYNHIIQFLDRLLLQ